MSSNYLSSFTSTNASNTDILSQINYVDYASTIQGGNYGNVGYFDVGNTRIVFSNGHIITDSGGQAWSGFNIGFGNIPTGFCNCYSTHYFYRVQTINYNSTSTSIQCTINSATDGVWLNFIIIGLKP